MSLICPRLNKDKYSSAAANDGILQHSSSGQIIKFHYSLKERPVPLCLTCSLADSSYWLTCERSSSAFTFVKPAGVAWHQPDTRARPALALALVLMIYLHPGNLLAPWKMPQRISSSAVACGCSVCESPPQQAPTGPLIPTLANSF